MDLIFLFFILFFSHLAVSDDPQYVPYEQCNWKNKEYTQNMIENVDLPESGQTSATALCLECALNDSTTHPLEELVQDIRGGGGVIAPICFYASMLKSKKTGFSNFFYCSDGDLQPNMTFHCESPKENCKFGEGPGHKREIYRRRFCLNQDYVRLTARSFHQMADCFGISDGEKRQLFALYNHESSFMLNAKSSGQAGCYGQLTSDVYHTLNRYVFFQDRVKQWQSEVDIYKNALNRCPFLKNKVVRQSFEENANSNKMSVDHYDDEFNAYSSAFTCAMSSDPYICFFYSMYNHQINKMNFYKAYHEISESSMPEVIAGKTSEEVHEHFSLPIKLNEVLHVEGTIKRKNGQDMQVNWIIASAHELRGILSRMDSYNREDLRIKKVKVFSPTVLEEDVLKRAYNGGGKVIETHLPVFLKNFKKMLSSADCKKQDLCSRYRANLEGGYPLTASILNANLSPYLSKTKINKEAVKYIDKVHSDLCYLHEKNNLMKKHINELSHSLSSREVSLFMDLVKNQCPKPSTVIPRKECEKNLKY